MKEVRGMTLEDRIYDLMEQNGISQAAVAAEMKISPQRLNDMLKRRRPFRAEHIGPLCRAVGCEPNELFGYEKKNHQITVTDSEGGVLAAVIGDSVVEHEGYHVILS